MREGEGEFTGEVWWYSFWSEAVPFRFREKKGTMVHHPKTDRLIRESSIITLTEEEELVFLD